MVLYDTHAITRDAPDIWPDNPALFDIRYPAGYRISLAGYTAGHWILKKSA
jgi:hypothetical protein